MPAPRSSENRWYPNATHVGSPAQLQATLKQVLDQHYALQDRFDAMQREHAAPKKSSGPPLGSGPSDTQICGLRVLPIDVQTLADGVKLTFVKKDGNFQFK